MSEIGEARSVCIETSADAEEKRRVLEELTTDELFEVAEYVEKCSRAYMDGMRSPATDVQHASEKLAESSIGSLEIINNILIERVQDRNA